MSSPLLPRLTIPRYLLADPAHRAEPGWSYHVVCEATDPGGNTVSLYSGRATCVVSSEHKQEQSLSASISYSTTTDYSTTETDILDNFFPQPSEDINLEGFDYDSAIQTYQIGETFSVANYYEGSNQPVVLTHLTECSETDANFPSQRADIDIITNELLSQLSEEDVCRALDGEERSQTEVSEHEEDVQVLPFHKNRKEENPKIFFLEEDFSNVCVEETYEVDEEVEKYMDEPLGNKNGDQENYICSKCNRKFSCHERWQSHKKAHSNPQLECPRCMKVLGSKASLKAHVKIHNRKFSCEYCARSYETEQQLKSHSLKKHTNFSCDLCEFSCRNAIDLDRHLKDHGENTTPEPNENKSFHQNTRDYDVFENLDVNDDDDIIVDDEDFDILKIGDYNRIVTEDLIHLSQEENSNFYEEENDTTVDTFEFQQNFIELEHAYKLISDIMQIECRNKHAKIKKKLTRDCQKCKKHFDRGSDFKRHAIEHVIQDTIRCAERDGNGVPDYRCRLCEGGTFNRIDKLKAHLRNHLKLRLYQCHRCLKTFSDSSNYSKHKKVHGTAVYQCDICKRKFNTKKMISQHMEYHRITKPLSCQFCDKVCYFESTLKKHINVHHKLRGNGAFSCQFCNCKFSSMKHKWDHQWSEHGIRKKINDCRYCDAKFRKYSELKKHLKEIHHNF